MKHRNLSFFIPHYGCPCQCSFCDQRQISGADDAPTIEQVRNQCREMLERYGGGAETEIAFFGGSFTAIPVEMQNAYLEAVQEFLGADGFSGIRLSTRPDKIDDGILQRLQGYGVTAIELGAQSMSDAVLEMNHRGHTAQAVRDASEMIKAYGFSLGLQQMAGLYGATVESDYESFRQIQALHPDTLRLYPTVILEGTELGRLYQAGIYQPYDMEKMLDLCAWIARQCQEQGIRLIRLGLHASEELQKRALGGYYHPALGELVANRQFRQQIVEMLKNCTGNFLLKTAMGTRSQVVGQKKCNVEYFAECGVFLKVEETSALQAGQIQIVETEGRG